MCAVADADTGLKDALDVSADANGFLRTFPLQALLSAQSPRDVASSLPPIFSHFQQKLKISPVRREYYCLYFVYWNYSHLSFSACRWFGACTYCFHFVCWN